MVPQQKPPAQPPPPYAVPVERDWEALGIEGMTGPGGSLAGHEGSTQSITRSSATGPWGPLEETWRSRQQETSLGLCLSFYCFCAEPLQWGRGRHREVSTPPTCLRPLALCLSPLLSSQHLSHPLSLISCSHIWHLRGFPLAATAC